MSRKSLTGLLIILIVWLPSILLTAAIHSIAGGTTYFGGDEDDEAYSIAVTDDLGFVIAGYTKSFGAGDADFWLLKYGPKTMIDTLNRTITYAGYYWNKTYGGTDDDVAKSVIQTSDGGFALAGYTNSSANGLDVWLVKTDSEGSMEWNFTYGETLDEAACSIIQTDDGGYLLAGYSAVYGQPRNTLVIKTDGLGIFEWNQSLPGQGSNQVTPCTDGGYAFTVSYPSAFGLAVINSSGFLQSSQIYPSSANVASAQSIINVEDGYVLAGFTESNETGEHGTWMLKTDSTGMAQWNRTYEKIGAYAMTKTIEGNYALTGDRASIMVTDSNGNLLLTKTHDGELGDGGKWFTRSYSITETVENHFYMAGTSNASGPKKYQAILVNSVLASDDTPPAVVVISPENGKAYPSDNIPLTVFVNKTTLFLWYNIDGKNATITGNTTLPTLADGPHNVTVYARDTSYNIGTSEPVFFSSETIQFVVDRSLNANPPEGTVTDNSGGGSETVDPPLDTVVLVAVVAAVAVSAAVAVAVFKSRLKSSKIVAKPPFPDVL